ncbi:ABC transporter substrate-binding protein [Caenimonas koreensis]|uniref:ABC transporter substrate-binding protein n=1 Tax=Caenimonas koreensis TaxID=367474 RepID=UPI0037835C92
MGFKTAGFALAMLVCTASHAGQIVVGQVAPLSGLDGNQGRAYAAGIQLALNNANKGAGINGNTLVLVRKDDAGNPESTLKLTKELIEQDKAIVLAGYFGISSIETIARSNILDKEQIALVGWRASQIRPETTNLFNVRASLRDELFKVAEHLSTVGITRLGIVYEQGPGSLQLMNSAGEAAQKAKGSVVAMAGFPAGTTNVQQAVQGMIKTQPQAIMFVGSGASAAAFIEQYRKAGGTASLFANDGVDMEQLGTKLDDAMMSGVSIAQAVPSPYKISSKIAKEFIDTVTRSEKLEVPVSYAMMEGYIAGKVVVEAIRRQGKSPTRQGTIDALGRMDFYDMGGYSVSYRPDIRAGSKFVELTILGGKGKIRQ